MKPLLMLTIWAMISCGTRKQEPDLGDNNVDKLLFDRYLMTLKQIEIPVQLTNSLWTDGDRYEYGEFRKFKTIWSDKPLGKLFVIGDKTVTADLQIGSIYAPALVVYDNVGHKLDSLYPLKKTGSDFDFETIEEVYIDENKQIMVISLTKNWQVSSDSSRLENTKTTSRDTVIYVVKGNGRFRKTKD